MIQSLQTQFSGQTEQGITEHLFQRQSCGFGNPFVKQGHSIFQL